MDKTPRRSCSGVRSPPRRFWICPSRRFLSHDWRTIRSRHITFIATEEIKLDGYRAVAIKYGDSIDLFSRRRKSFIAQYPYIVEALRDLPEGTVVDGEIVALDDAGKPNFNLLSQFRSRTSRICYFIFDLLICQDRDLTRLPLSDRRELMKSHLQFYSPRIRITEQFDVSATDMLAAVRQQQLEGVIGKRKGSLYQPGNARAPGSSTA